MLAEAFLLKRERWGMFFLYKKGILKVFVLFFCQKFHDIGLVYFSFIAPREYAD